MDHNVIKAPLSLQGGYNAAAAVIKTGVTAAFAGNDDMAIGLMRGLKEQGVKVPDQISVMGYDDFYLDEYVSPQLTTIRQPIMDLGIGAAKMLLNKIHSDQEQEQIQRFPVELIQRQSTARVRTPL